MCVPCLHHVVCHRPRVMFKRLQGYHAAVFALVIGNAASAATLVETVFAPASRAWTLSLVVSSLLEVLTRTGMMQRIELKVAARLAAHYGLQWPMRAVQCNALKLVYLRSLGGTGYVAQTMALCIGCLRAVTLGDVRAIVWLDISETVWHVLLAQFVVGVLVDAAVWAVEKNGLNHFELSPRFTDRHPLGCTAFRDFDAKGYAMAFSSGAAFIYGVFVAFLGPAFVMGMCRDLAPTVTHIWVLRTLDCVNATAVASATNETLRAAARL